MAGNGERVHCSGSGLRPTETGNIGGTCPVCDGWYPINDYGVIPRHERDATAANGGPT